MPTAHRRINVTCDPELAAAMEVTRELLPQQSDAARLRALALTGARALAGDVAGQASMQARHRLLSRPDVFPASSRDRTLPWLDDLLKDEPSDQGTRALEWVRGER